MSERAPDAGGPTFAAPTVLLAEHETAQFRCGESELDRFLHQSALNRQKAMLSRTYVALTEATVVGYYTLAHVQLQAEQMPPKIVRNARFHSGSVVGASGGG